MSYTIIYERLFVKVQIGEGLGILPLILAGSNNVTEISPYSNSERRARDWSLLSSRGAEFNENYGLPVVLDYETDEHFDRYVAPDADDTHHFKYNSKWINTASFKRFWKNGVKMALTIEEINERRLYPVGLSVLVFEERDRVEHLTSHNCQTSKALADALFEAGKYKLEQEEKGSDAYIYIYVGFTEEDVLKREKLKGDFRTKVNRSVNHVEEQGYAYFIKSGSSFVRKLTARGIYTQYSHGGARQFKTEKLAQKWIDGIRERKSFDKDFMDGLEIVKIKKED